MISQSVLVIDVETTGFDPGINACIEVGAILLDHNQEFAGEFSSMIAPWEGAEIVEAALEVSGIARESLWVAPPLQKVIQDFHTKFGSQKNLPVIAGWNVWFDVSFLRDLYRRGNLRWPFGHRFIDIQSVAAFFNGLHPASQEKFISKKLHQKQTHRALSDARHTSEILQSLTKAHWKDFRRAQVT